VIWQVIVENTREDQNQPQREGELSPLEQAYAGFPQSFRTTINEAIQTYYPTAPEQLPLEKQKTVKLLKSNLAQGLLGILMAQLPKYENIKITDTSLAQLLVKIHNQAFLKAIQLDPSCEGPLTRETIKSLISKIDLGGLQDFVSFVYTEVKKIPEKDCPQIVKLLYLPLAQELAPTQPKKQPNPPTLETKKEFAKKYAEAFVKKNGTDGETPMWGGEGGIPYAQAANLPERENYLWTAKTEFPKERPQAPVIYNGNNHCNLLLPRANAYWENLR
ncbi:MAG: hypothetical protein JSR80_03850, partial [Verrucomicrobia bacterium]|nr:hypothetical protein [Verrucomicrobiota bacterium]